MSFEADRPSAQPGPGHSFMASTCALSDGDSRPTTPHRVDGRYRTMLRGGITLGNRRVQRERARNRLLRSALSTSRPSSSQGSTTATQ